MCCCTGVACGAVGIGGVFLTPTLILLGVPPHVSTVSIITAFLPLSFVQTGLLLQRKKVHKIAAGCLCLGAVPGSTLAAVLLNAIPGMAITITVSVVASLSGLHTMRNQFKLHRQSTKNSADCASTSTVVDATTDAVTTTISDLKVDSKGEDIKAAALELQEQSVFVGIFLSSRDRAILVIIGFVAGFLSILTASSGPFCIIPLMFLCFGRSMPPDVSVALAFAAGTCICGAGAIFAAVTAEVDYGLVMVAYISLQCGTPLGTWVADKISKDKLRALIAILLLGLGIYSLIKVGISASQRPTSTGNGGGTNATA